MFKRRIDIDTSRAVSFKTELEIVPLALKAVLTLVEMLSGGSPLTMEG
jgi:hypothetical protein